MSLDSWMHATRIDLEWRREEISRWEFWMPLQLNCRMAPSEWSGWGGGEGGSIGEEGGGEEGGVEEGVGGGDGEGLEEDGEEGVVGEGGGGGGEQAGHPQLECQSACLGKPEHLKCTQPLQREHRYAPLPE